MKAAGSQGCPVGLVTLLFCAGCATFQSEHDAVARYEKTRDEMNRVARGDWQRPSFEEEVAA